MGVPKRLTEMQQRFAEYLVFGNENGPMTKREAAIAAGYSKDRAMREGSELTNPKYSHNDYLIKRELFYDFLSKRKESSIVYLGHNKFINFMLNYDYEKVNNITIYVCTSI